MTAEKKLTEIRHKIDAIDQQLQTLLNQRAECALEVAKAKQQDKNSIVYRPEREANVLRNIMQRNTGPLSAKDMAEIFLFIMAKCRALQQPVTIAFPSVAKNIAKLAAFKHFGQSIRTKSCTTITRVFQSIMKKAADYGVVPIESATQGTINETLDALMQYPLRICGEIELPTAKNKSQDPLRFLILSNQIVAPSGHDKTSLLISIANKPGSLAKIFQPFANHRVNITSFVARPSANMHWNYLFFIDVEGHEQDIAVQNALNELSQQPLTYTILGSYPSAVL